MLQNRMLRGMKSESSDTVKRSDRDYCERFIGTQSSDEVIGPSGKIITKTT